MVISYLAVAIDPKRHLQIQFIVAQQKWANNIFEINLLTAVTIADPKGIGKVQCF